MSRFRNRTPAPFLNPLDSGFKQIPFQFTPNSFTENISSGYAEANALNRAHPIIQFTRGESESISFEAQLFASNNTEDVEPLLDLLKKAVRRDEKLKRPPTWILVIGSYVNMKCVVASIGGIKYDPMRSDGTVRSATCDIELRRYEPFDISLTDPNARPTNTFYRVVRSGDLWEHLAGRQYGDPDKGELLRRLNPDQPFPIAGKTILMPDAEKLDDVVISPDSIPLARTVAGVALARDMFTLRNKPLFSAVLKK